jgi:PIN domain nuclease of toxin-antitoxin system
VRILLDTHILLWCLGEDSALPQQARALIADATNQVFISPISLWEVAIKAQIGKIVADVNEIRTAALAIGFHSLPFTLEHAAAVAQLPTHHRDPFDRALVAQAHCEPLRLLTHDRALVAYGEPVMLV